MEIPPLFYRTSSPSGLLPKRKEDEEVKWEGEEVGKVQEEKERKKKWSGVPFFVIPHNHHDSYLAVIWVGYARAKVPVPGIAK